MICISVSTTATIYQLVEQTLPHHRHDFIVFNDNFFSTPELFTKLRLMGAGAGGPSRVQNSRYSDY